jgi:hypothetical protein
VEIVVDRGFLLPAVRVEVLLEKSLLIEEADADHRQPQFAGRLEVIPRQDAQPAGVHRQAVGQRELGREIADAIRAAIAPDRLIPGLLAREVGVEFLADAVEVGEKSAVLRRVGQPALIDAPQHQGRIVPALLPELSIQAAEDVPRGVVPRPIEIVGQIPKALQARRQRGHHRERLDGFHRSILRCRGARRRAIHTGAPILDQSDGRLNPPKEVF